MAGAMRRRFGYPSGPSIRLVRARLDEGSLSVTTRAWEEVPDSAIISLSFEGSVLVEGVLVEPVW